MLVRHHAKENRPAPAGRCVVEAAGLEPASASAPSARFYERSSRSSFACLDGPGRRREASPLCVPPVPRARARRVSPLADTGNRAVGRPDRWPLLFKQRQPSYRRRVLLLPAFYESPANSARLAGRRPLTSKPVAPVTHILTFWRGLSNGAASGGGALSWRAPSRARQYGGRSRAACRTASCGSRPRVRALCCLFCRRVSGG
jgi:hypothetical protein